MLRGDSQQGELVVYEKDACEAMEELGETLLELEQEVWKVQKPALENARLRAK